MSRARNSILIGFWSLISTQIASSPVKSNINHATYLRVFVVFIICDWLKSDIITDQGKTSHWCRYCFCCYRRWWRKSQNWTVCIRIHNLYWILRFSINFILFKIRRMEFQMSTLTWLNEPLFNWILNRSPSLECKHFPNVSMQLKSIFSRMSLKFRVNVMFVNVNAQHPINFGQMSMSIW